MFMYVVFFNKKKPLSDKATKKGTEVEEGRSSTVTPKTKKKVSCTKSVRMQPASKRYGLLTFLPYFFFNFILRIYSNYHHT